MAEEFLTLMADLDDDSQQTLSVWYTGEMIGDCGLTLQLIDGEMLPEIGYHIRANCQRKGYAKEAASAIDCVFPVPLQ